MAQVANVNQPVRRAVPAIIPVYSRQVLVQLVAPGFGGDHATTPPLGNRLVLKGVDVWFMPTAHNTFINGSIVITGGSGRKPSEADIELRWKPVMDTSMIFKNMMLIYCCAWSFHFSMTKLYVGQSQKFGVVIYNTAAQQYTCIVAFEIAEG